MLTASQLANKKRAEIKEKLIISWIKSGWEHNDLSEQGKALFEEAEKRRVALNVIEATIEFEGVSLVITETSSVAAPYGIMFL